MGSIHFKQIILLLATVLWANFTNAQAPFLKEVLILNGGQFGNPQENATLVGFDPATGNTRVSDTIHTQSIQDLLIDGDYAYVAAQDSLVKIRLSDFSRVATVAFPGASTYTMAINLNQLLVGNWYGQTDSNLYVFDKTDLTLDYVVPQIERGVKSIAIIGDTAYLSQNFDDASFSDSAGYLALVYLPTGTFVKNVPGDNVSDIGKLITFAGGIIGIGSATDMASFYDPIDGSLSINPIGVDVAGGYGSVLQLVGDTLFGVYDGKLGSIDVTDGSIINASIVDTLITAFAYDTLNQQFYVTQTDYFSYTRGIVFDKTGVAVDTFKVGYAPESVKLVYGLTVGISDVAGYEASVYPNPVSNLLSIKTTHTENITMVLRDLAGRVLYNTSVIEGQTSTIDVSNLAPGLYLLQSADGRFTQKVLKQ